jgi:hypothetical protein
VRPKVQKLRRSQRLSVHFPTRRSLSCSSFCCDDSIHSNYEVERHRRSREGTKQIWDRGGKVRNSWALNEDWNRKRVTCFVEGRTGESGEWANEVKKWVEFR